MEAYLAACDIIDWRAPAIVNRAASLRAEKDDVLAIAKACFLFVRDEIKHSADFQLNPVTCKASDVLEHGSGYCYAKSHLLAALLRANGIPSGLCYQRLTIDNDRPPFCLHGLNAVYLPDYGWYRIDARGNKPDVAAEFTPPVEKLAFPLVTNGEADLPGIWPRPLGVVVSTLNKFQTVEEVAENLPDISLNEMHQLAETH